KAADHVGPEDGIDPRLERSGGSRRPNRKALQLADQVMQTLAGVLAGEGDDEVMRDLMVLAVEPAPTGGRLLVALAPPPPSPPHPLEVIQERLGRHAEQLRAEVAAAIHRRKMPDLAFQVRLLPRSS